MPRGRTPTYNKRVQIRLPDELYAQLYLLVPEIKAPDGATRYGKISAYITSLVSQDLAQRRQKLLKLDLPIPEAQKGGDVK